MIDVSKFRAGLDIEKCTQGLFWADRDFPNQLLDDKKNLQASNPDYGHIIAAPDECSDELRKIFHTSGSE